MNSVRNLCFHSFLTLPLPLTLCHLLIALANSLDPDHARIQEFSSGGPGQSDKKSSDNIFFFFFSPQLILLNSQPKNSLLLPKLGQITLSLLVLFTPHYICLKAIFIATANGLPKCKAS